MRRRSTLLMLLALLFAAGVTLWLRGEMAQKEEAAAKPAMILAATADIAAGNFVRAEKDYNFIPWPADKILPSHITPETAKLEDYNGAVARRNITNGEPITPTALVKSSEGGFLAAVMDPGMRAVSIGVSPTSGNAGFILPGDHVDLILTHEVDVGEGEEKQKMLASETFVTGARVLAVDQRIANPEREIVVAKTVTIEVSPKQAEKVQVAQRLGELSLSLRSLGRVEGEAEATDLNENLTRGSDVSRLLNSKTGTPSKVQLIRGNESEALEFLK